MINDKNVTFMLEKNVECIYLNYMNVMDVWNNHMPNNAWKMFKSQLNEWKIDGYVISWNEWSPAFVADEI